MKRIQQLFAVALIAIAQQNGLTSDAHAACTGGRPSL